MSNNWMMELANPQRLEAAMKGIETIITTSNNLNESQRKVLAWLLFARKQYGAAILIPIEDDAFELKLAQKIPGFKMEQAPIFAAMQHGYDIGAFKDAYNLVLQLSQMNNSQRVSFVKNLIKRKKYADARVLLTLVQGAEADNLRQRLKSATVGRNAHSNSSRASTPAWIKVLAILLGLMLLLFTILFLINML